MASVGGAGSADGAVDDDATTVVAGSAAVPADTAAQGIRAVDFGEVPQPGAACSDGLRFRAPGEIPVSDGSSRVLDLANLTRLNVDPEVAYGDLDGDGTDEAVVHVTCSFGANGAVDSVHVWRLEDDGELDHVAGLDEPTGEAVGGNLPPAVQDVTVAGEAITVAWSHYAEGDPNCCPSGTARLDYVLEDGDLEPVGEPVVEAVRP